jgi:hypothetical protein
MSPNQEQTATKLVWYASYGSNLKRERFMYYIKGGTPQESTKQYPGSRNQNDPIESQPIALEFELYFAGQSEAWGNGGVAFIRENPERGPTLGRMYLIADEQFNDVVMQENSKKPDGTRNVPAFDQLVSPLVPSLPDNPLYGKLLNIGSVGGHPILTFTTARTDLPNPNPPTAPYVRTIASGIKEAYPRMSEDDIVDYLSRADGIRGKIGLREIRSWVSQSR